MFTQGNDFGGSRKNGEKIREEIISKLKKENGIMLDFTDISIITQSFADEIIGILTRINGVTFIKENIKINNANTQIKSMLNYVVKYSKKHFIEEAA
jgi:hypothetical protein